MGLPTTDSQGGHLTWNKVDRLFTIVYNSTILVLVFCRRTVANASRTLETRRLL